jgi:hypothetical protein
LKNGALHNKNMNWSPKRIAYNSLFPKKGEENENVGWS